MAKRFSGLVMALNSRLLPEGSLKKQVYCSPGMPSKRSVGACEKVCERTHDEAYLR